MIQSAIFNVTNSINKLTTLYYSFFKPVIQTNIRPDFPAKISHSGIEVSHNLAPTVSPYGDIPSQRLANH